MTENEIDPDRLAEMLSKVIAGDTKRTRSGGLMVVREDSGDISVYQRIDRVNKVLEPEIA